jgi:tetratricopeptide (TPR) repeat protein
MAALLANEGEIGKARAQIVTILDRSANRPAILMQMSHLFGKFPDKAAVLEATRGLTSPYLAMPEAHYAIGVAAILAGKVDLASLEADEALILRPSWQQGAILKAQILRKSSPAEVLPFYEAFVREHPDSVEVRMQLGRELAAERKLAEAREQFREVEKLARNDAQAAYAIGLLSLQLDDFSDAQLAFTRALKLGYREPTAIYLGMGQAAEGLKLYDDAIHWYQKVESGDWVRAQLKIATLIAKQQGLPAGANTCAASSRRRPRTTCSASRWKRSCCATRARGRRPTRCSRRRSRTIPIRTSCCTTARWPRSASTSSTCSRPTSSA